MIEETEETPVTRAQPSAAPAWPLSPPFARVVSSGGGSTTVGSLSTTIRRTGGGIT